MRLQSTVLIRRAPEIVGQFLAEIGNIQKWDRGVGSARATSNERGVGFEFETLGRSDRGNPEKARMGYRIVCAEPNHCTVALITSSGNARFFERAQWDFRLAPVPEGSLLTCCAEFTLRKRYVFLGPLLYLRKRAIQMDLEALKQAVEKEL